MRHKIAFALLLLGSLCAAGCGGGGGGSSTPPPSNPTVLSVASTGVPATMQVGGPTATLSCTVTMSDGSDGGPCTFTSSNPSVASINAATNVLTAISAGTANITATSTKDSSKSSTPSTVTVTPAIIPPTITSVTATSDKPTITTAETSTITATDQGTGAFNSAVTWTATNGIVSGTGNSVTFTPTAVGTATITACSTATGFTTVCGSASVIVTRATPVLTSATVLGSSWIFCPISCNKSIVGIVLSGTGIKAGDTVVSNNYWPTISLPSANISANGTKVTFQEQCGNGQQPGPINFSVVPTDGTPASGKVTFAYVNGYNSASHGPNEELINQNFGKAYVWQNVGGTLTNTLSFADGGLNTVYETDGTNAYFVNGDYYTLDGTLASGPSDDGWFVSGTSAENGTVTLTEPGANEIALYKPVPNPSGPQQTNRFTVGTMPYTSVMVTINGITYELVASVDGTPTLWKIDTNGTSVGSAQLTGITSLSESRAAGVVVGGWPMAVFHTGTAAGKLAFVSTYDKSLLLFDATNNALPLLKTVPLPCAIPSAVDAIDATGHFVVACIETGTKSGTIFLDIDPVAGTATTLTSTSTKFPLGFLADATNLYVFYGAGAPDVQPNK